MLHPRKLSPGVVCFGMACGARSLSKSSPFEYWIWDVNFITHLCHPCHLLFSTLLITINDILPSNCPRWLSEPPSIVPESAAPVRLRDAILCRPLLPSRLAQGHGAHTWLMAPCTSLRWTTAPTRSPARPGVYRSQRRWEGEAKTLFTVTTHALL